MLEPSTHTTNKMFPIPDTNKTTICCIHCHMHPCICVYPVTDKPKSESLAPGVEQVPFEGIEAIGKIFEEGAVKYGRDNWKKDPSNAEYNTERTRHALRHLTLWANGDRSEPHLAKVAWFCVTTIWREKHSI